MSTNIGALYASLLEDPDCPVTVQDRALAWGLRYKDVTLLSRLAAHPALADHIDRTLGEHPAARVRAAWLARADRTFDDRISALKGEKRAGVLAVLAVCRDLPTEAYQLLADSGLQKVAHALLVNPAVPLPVRRKAAVTWGAFGTGSRSVYDQEARVAGLMASSPELHDDVASKTEDRAILRFVAGSDVSVATQRKIIELTIVAPLSAESAADWNSRQQRERAYQTASTLGANPVLDAGLRAKLTTFFDQFVESNVNLQGPLAAARTAMRSAPRQTNGEADALVAARSTEDPAALERLVADALAGPSPVLAAAVLSNPLAGPDVVRQLASMIRWPQVSVILEQRSDDIAFLAALIARHPGMFEDRILTRSGRPAEALRAIVEETVSINGRIPSELCQSRYLTTQTLLHFPVWFLATQDTPTQVRAATAAALEEHLGADPSRWALFEGVGDGFDRSLGELLEACNLLSGMEGFQAEEPAPVPVPSSPERPDPARGVVDAGDNENPQLTLL